MWKEAALLLLGTFVGGLLNALIDKVKARTAAEYWEAQERWKFKASIYSRALSAMRRMRAHLEVAAARGRWPEEEEKKRLEEASNELIEPAMLARLWLPVEATSPLETLGDRLLQLERYANHQKEQLMRACEVLQEDINRLVAVARDDLRLQEAHRESRWRWWTKRKM